jgi:hypothetical protein
MPARFWMIGRAPSIVIAKPMFSPADADPLAVVGEVAGPRCPRRTPDVRNRRGPKAPAVSHRAH